MFSKMVFPTYGSFVLDKDGNRPDPYKLFPVESVVRAEYILVEGWKIEVYLADPHWYVWAERFTDHGRRTQLEFFGRLEEIPDRLLFLVPEIKETIRETAPV